ncbi:MAG: insulinase family protein [Nanoarchaeota archaeon]|nr:insulinase family protein [Nanoarchaeota archaeon]
MEKRDLPVVSLSITNRFGAGYEKSEIKGIAHFIEHLIFTGTKKRTSEEISREIEKRGGILNAFTSHEVTSFWFKLPSEHLFFGLDVLKDILTNTLFNKEKFDKEKKVIIEEIKMYHDEPRSHAFEMIEKNLFEPSFGDLVIGSKETVEGLERDFVADYFRKNYNPRNFIVTVVGNVNFDEICEYFEKNFEANESEIGKIEIKKKNGESVEKRRDIDQAHVVFAAHAPLKGDKRHYALEILNAYLAGGMSSKLFVEIREKRGLAYAVRGDIVSEKNYSYYVIYVGTTKEAFEEVKNLILQGIKDVEKMGEDELKESKEKIIGLKRISLEESSNVMNDLMFEELVGKAENYYDYDNQINAVKLNDVKKLAKEFAKEYSFASVVPDEKRK